MSDQTWEGEIRIVGDIYSPTNSRVTILPGTKVIVSINNDKSNMDLLPWHRKSGVNTGPSYKGVNTGEPFWDEAQKIQIHFNNLMVLGEWDKPVIFVSDSNNDSPFDFNVISMNKGVVDNGRFSNYRRFEIGGNVLITNSDFKDIGECALCLSRGKPKIVNNTFEKTLRESIWVSRASPEISNNLFANLFGEGIKIDAKRLSVPIITNNTFEMPQQVPLNLVSGGQIEEGLVARNFFSGNSEVKIACDSKIRFRDNVILGQISFSSGCDGKFVFGPNYWGTPDSRTILSDKVLNKHPSFSIEIPTVLISPPKDAGRR